MSKNSSLANLHYRATVLLDCFYFITKKITYRVCPIGLVYQNSWFRVTGSHDKEAMEWME